MVASRPSCHAKLYSDLDYTSSLELLFFKPPKQQPKNKKRQRTLNIPVFICCCCFSVERTNDLILTVNFKRQRVGLLYTNNNILIVI